MTKFSIFVTKAPFDSNNAYSALKFCEAAIKSGHTIVQVFFYSGGVHIANSLTHFNADERDLAKLWVTFSQRNNIPLNICTTAGIRRGLASKDDEMGFDNYTEGFNPVGMLEYFIALNSSDIKSVQF